MKKIKLLSILLGLCMSISLFTACDLSGLVNGMIPDDNGGNTNETNRNGENAESKEEESHLHKVVIEEGFAPTCTEYGRTDGSYCAICGERLSEPELIPPTGHELDEYGQCRICGEYFADNESETDSETTYPWWGETDSETDSETVYETDSETTYPWWETESETEARQPTEGLAYDPNDEGNGYIVYDIGKATDKDIVIPSEYNGLPVVKIDAKAFEGYDITSVYIPGTVKEIGLQAFHSCTNLEAVYISEGVETIGESAFYCCYALRSVYIPGTVASMGYGAFSNCSSLMEITLGEGIKAIPHNAFSYTYNLREIVIPDSVKSIDSYAFSGCQYLERVVIGSGSMLESISKYSFERCDNLQYNTYSNASYLGNEDNPYMILVKADNQKIRSCEIHSQTKVIAQSAFEGCFSIKSLQIPEGVIRIGESAFSGCTSLQSITIPNSVISMGINIFNECNALESVTMPLVGKKIEDGLEVDMRFGDYFGWNVPETLKTVVINGGDKIGEYAFYICSGLTSITIPDGVTSIGGQAFCGCTGLTSITIPDGVTSIGREAFSGCTGLTSITIPDGVTSIGGRAFCGCSGLTSITIPDGVTSIGEEAFSGCTGLTSITIPDSVISIGINIFNECNALESVTMPLIGKKIEDGLEVDMRFYDYFGWNVPETLKTVVINGGDTIGEGIFESCSRITSITITDGVTSIGTGAFAYCYGLTSITIPDSVTSISDGVFAFCPGIASITVDADNTVYHSADDCIIETASKTLIAGCKNSVIPNDGSVTSIGDSAFAYCSGLTSITIPDSVTSIGYRAFYWCSSLTSVTIPDSVTSIGEKAFSDCSNLTDIYFGGSEAEWQTLTSGNTMNLGAYSAMVHFAGGEETQPGETEPSAD